ncbi:MAG: DUF3127 domain-containing protein [Bacteroidetes bacterium]|nr:MAG: DUF3127 domain-containing protein [Bacteroidota bacterium]
MSLDVTGRIIQKMDVVTGTSARGEWKKQEFVIETAEQYPKKICLSLWGDKVDALGNFKEGDFIQASLNLESREYNGRWYTEARAWRLQAPQGAQDGNNFAEAPQQFSENDGIDFSSSESDDLPF